jgi:hypothetical protein
MRLRDYYIIGGALSRISLVAHTVSYKARSVCLLTPLFLFPLSLGALRDRH